jgi:hypothetical protein
MEFEGNDSESVIDLLKADQVAFGQALLKMQLVDNYDNRMPSGLVKFSKFFYAHHKEVYANGKNPEVVHKLFLAWLVDN